MADPRRRRAELRQPLRAGSVQQSLPVFGHRIEQRLADELVAEAIPARRALDDHRGQRGVQAVKSVVLGRTGQHDELVGVERGAGDRDVLEHVAHPRLEQAQHHRTRRTGPRAVPVG